METHDWLSVFSTAARAFREPHRVIVGPPPNTCLKELVKARKLLGVDDAVPRPGLAASEQFASETCGNAAKESMVEIVSAAINDIDKAITAAIAQAHSSNVHRAGII